MSDAKEILEFHIYPHLDLAAVFEDLQPRDKGRYYLALCPHCQKREAYIYKSGKYLSCNRRNKCAHYIRVWDYLQQRKNLTNQETLKELARLANYTLPDNHEYSDEKIQQARETANILEATMEYFKTQLRENPGALEVKKYLATRGYTNHLEAMELGYFPGHCETELYLTGKRYHQETIQEVFTYIQFREDYKIVFPYRGPGGRIKSIWGRLTRPLKEGEKENRKYLPFSKTDKDSLFNLHEWSGAKTFIVVEGYLDARFATALGIKGVVATGGACLTEKQIETACRYGMQNIIFAMDNDPSGYEGTERAIKSLMRKKLKAYVAILPQGFKDPDELMRKQGAQPFLEAIRNSISAARWQTQRIIGKHDLQTDQGQRDCFDEILAFENILTIPLDSKAVIDMATDALGIAPEMLEFTIVSYRERKAQEELESEYRKLLSKAQAKLQNREISELGEFLEKEAQTIRIAYQKIIAKPAISFASRLQAQFEEEKNRQEGLLGYKLQTFKQLACHLDGIQLGLYIIGADTNIGKTAFLTNIFLDLLFTNPELKGIYFSLDDTYKVITTRFRGIMTRIPLNQLKRQLLGDANAKKLEVQELLLSWAKTGKLLVKDLSEIQSIHNLELDIRKCANDNLFVAIDGLYNLEVSKSGGIREENIERANKLKAMVDTYEIPIITTAEVRKKGRGEAQDRVPTVHDLMETSKFSYNSNVVWTLYPESNGQKNDNEETLILDYAKNKLSHFKRASDTA